MLFWLANEIVERLHKTFAEKNGLTRRLNPNVYEDSYARARGSLLFLILLKVLLLNFSTIFPARNSGFVIQRVCTVVGIKARNDQRASKNTRLPDKDSVSNPEFSATLVTLDCWTTGETLPICVPTITL